MDKFDAVLNGVLCLEDVNPISRNSLDPSVFQFFDDGREPMLQDMIKAQILVTIDSIHSIFPITRFYLVGDILTHCYTKYTPLIVYLYADAEQFKNTAEGEVLYTLKQVNGKIATGTTHPINYIASENDIPESKYPAIYDIGNERWIKTMPPVSDVVERTLIQLGEMMQTIDVKTGKIVYNRMFMETALGLKPEDLKSLMFRLTSKLDILNTEIAYLTTIQQQFASLYGVAMTEKTPLEELIRYNNRLKIPDPLMSKLFERYYTAKFMEKIIFILNRKKTFDIPDTIKHTKLGKHFREA